MSAYGVVIPVSWRRLWDRVLTDWCGVMAGTTSLRSFCGAYAPAEAEWLETIPQVIPAGYLDSIGWQTDAGPLLASALRASPIHAQLEGSGIAEAGGEFLSSAIKAVAGADIASTGRFDAYYARLHEEPRRQVAGFKNRPYFLEALFSFSYDRQAALYRCRSTLGKSNCLCSLLSKLFLSVRTFPGVRVLSESMAWPAFDDLRVVGYLVPEEVCELAERLGLIDSLSEKGDRQLPLFVDRVECSAQAGYGLVAIHSGL